jgi:hypothetical protein
LSLQPETCRTGIVNHAARTFRRLAWLLVKIFGIQAEFFKDLVDPDGASTGVVFEC